MRRLSVVLAGHSEFSKYFISGLVHSSRAVYASDGPGKVESFLLFNSSTSLLKERKRNKKSDGKNEGARVRAGDVCITDK